MYPVKKMHRCCSYIDTKKFCSYNLPVLVLGSKHEAAFSLSLNELYVLKL